VIFFFPPGYSPIMPPCPSSSDLGADHSCFQNQQQIAQIFLLHTPLLSSFPVPTTSEWQPSQQVLSLRSTAKNVSPPPIECSFFVTGNSFLDISHPPPSPSVIVKLWILLVPEESLAQRGSSGSRGLPSFCLTVHVCSPVALVFVYATNARASPPASSLDLSLIPLSLPPSPH